MDLIELLAKAADLPALSDDELAELRTELHGAADALLDGDLTDEALADLEKISEVTKLIDAEDTSRAEDVAARQARAEELRKEIKGEDVEEVTAEDPEVEEPAEPAEEDGEEDGEKDDAEEVEATEETEADADDAPVEKVTVSAAAKPRIGRVAARRPEAMKPRAPKPSAALSLRASANVPGMTAGEHLDSPDKIVRALAQTIQASAGYRGPRVVLPVMSLGAFDPREMYGDARTLTRDAQHNDELIRAVVSPSAVTASGGRCAPSVVRYDFPTVGTDARPVRDSMLAKFGVDRGGVRLFPPVTFDDVDDGVAQWTNTNDVTPSSPTTKPCAVMTCATDTETLVYAVTRCLEIGNFRAKFFGEQVEEWLTKLSQWHARYAETKLLTTIGTESTQVATGTVLGTSRDVLTVLDRARAAYISRHRADPAQRLRFAAPFWLRDQMRTDLAREAPGSSDERLAVADATIDSFFAARGINPTWFLDGESGQVFTAQGDAALNGWPSTVVTYLFAEGDWLFLDGGTLDFGVVRDSVLNSTNDFQMAAETFEGAAFHGIESLRITMDTCPDGSTSAPIDINPCTTGS